MNDVAVRGLWRGKPVTEMLKVDLNADINAQQKQITRLTAGMLAANDNLESGVTEKPSDFALRLGFTKLDYQYQQSSGPVVVDVLDPSKTI